MSITYRTNKGSPLTYEELDENFNYLNGLASSFSLADYDALRSYSGASDSVIISGYLVSSKPSGIAGLFVRDDSDTTSTDNGGTIIVSLSGKRWKRVYDGYRVDLRWFGAKGDGIADDSAAINAAIAALPASGGELKVAGSFKHGSKITVGKRITISGVGTAHTGGVASQSEFLKASTLNDTGFVLAANAIAVHGVAFRGEVGNGGDGVLLKAARIALRDVAVYQMGQDGIKIGTDTGGENCNLWYLDNVKSKVNGRHGLHISEGPGALADANGGTGVHLDIQSNTLDGIYIGGGQLNNFYNATLQNNGQYGLHLSATASYNAFFGGDIEANSGGQVRLESGAIHNAILCYTINLSMISNASTSNPNRIECIDYNKIMSGLAFPPAQVSSSDSNTLDDYEEGVFTPTITGVTTAGTGTYTTQLGKYTKVGRLVHFTLNIQWTAHGGTGNTEISGLPFVAGATSIYDIVNVFQSGGPATAAGGVRTGFIQPGTSKVQLREMYPASATLTNSNVVTASGLLWISGTYTTA